jgi:beta-mannanase
MRLALAALLALLLGVATAAGVFVLSGRLQPSQVPGLNQVVPPSLPPLAGTLQPSASGTYWGAYVPGAQDSPSPVASFAARSGRQPAIVTMYMQWWHEPPFPKNAAHWLQQKGSVPLIVWEPWQPNHGANQAQYRLSTIAQGGFDQYVRSFADQARDYRGPLFLEPMHEMNGTWYPWGGTVNGNTVADYIAAWRHLHDVFRAEGASNVTWVWTINRDTVPETAANQPQEYWPGPDYVDWVGLDAYNWGSSPTTAWNSVTKVLGARVALLQSYEKPIIVAETACAEPGGDKAAWISDLFGELTGDYRGVIDAAVWFNEPFGPFDWRTNSSPSAQASFVSGVAKPGVLSAPWQ